MTDNTDYQGITIVDQHQPRLTRVQQLIALLALGAILIALWMLFAAEREITIRHTRVDGIPVSVFTRRDAPPAPAVLIGHGFAGSRQLMQPFAITLAQNGYVAVAFDFPGHGHNRNPLTGELGETERAQVLLDAFRRVARYARELPASDGRLATLGHSMAGDVLVRYADREPEVDASIAVSPYLSRPLGADGTPPNLLFVYGEYEPEMIMQQGREALATVAALAPAEIELDTTYGNMAEGSARRMVIADGVEHIGVLYSSTSLRAALDWLNQVYDRDSNGLVDARGPWLGLFYAGILLLTWPLSQLLPRIAQEPLGARLGWRRLLPLVVVPAVLTPLILWPIPSDFLSIVIGDYIALHFGLYGLLTLLLLVLVGHQQPAALWQGVSAPAFVLALLCVGIYQTLAVALPTDRFVSSFIPDGGRTVTMLVLFGAALLWFAADEWLTRGGAPGAYALTKLLFLVSLMLAVALNLNELFFLVIIIPAILILFVLYGLFSTWIYNRTNYPLVAAVTNALAFASVITVSFPMVE
ncbi:MAG: hypothetical protein N838_11300 [Thiohalocapsa sp. PB-PSB1]|nr:MAG: hypothetical protein N838_11300 [Thiohalocapsa sp. PB-PSB1]